MDMQSASTAKSNAAPDCVKEGDILSLTFTAVDSLAFAAARARLLRLQSKTFVVDRLGPLVELLQLSSDGLLPPLSDVPWIAFGKQSNFYAALQGDCRCWICPTTKRYGFIRTTDSENDQANAFRFCSAAQKAAVEGGFTKQGARQLTAALGEMLDNIYQHSKMPETGLAVFGAQPGVFEFVVADRGIGVLQSLRECSEYARLLDHGDALEVALTDGCSKHGSNTKHGLGFRSLFVGLSNLNGYLRFRSGDHALTIEGTNPKCIPWRKIAKPRISGFLASVSCQVG
jgi:hypothetical protein